MEVGVHFITNTGKNEDGICKLICVNMYISMYIYIYICVYIYIHVHMYVCMYIYICLYRQRRGWRGVGSWFFCKTLQHTATHCNTLQHTATHWNELKHTATRVYVADGGGWGVDSFAFDIRVLQEVCRELGVRYVLYICVYACVHINIHV